MVEITTGSWSAPIWFRRTYAATILVVSSLWSVGDGGSSGILVLPVEIDKIPCRAKSRCRNRNSIKVLRRSAHLLSVPCEPKQPPEFCRIDLGDRKRDLGRRFFGLHGMVHRIHNILSIYFGDIGRILDIFSTKAMGHTTSAPRVSIQLVSDDLI